MNDGADALAWRATAALRSDACVFVDRDGVLNERVHDGYVLTWNDFRWRPDAKEAVQTLTLAGVPVVVVSNQSGVGRGLMPVESLLDIMRRMTDELAAAGGPLTAWYACPHAPSDGCDCRKPKPGMLHRAARELKLDLSRCTMIGDTETDVAAGAAAGCATHLIDPSDPRALLRVATAIVAKTARTPEA